MHNKTAKITISNFISMQVSTFISIYKEHDIPSPTPMTVKKRATSSPLFFHLQWNCIFSVAFKCCDYVSEYHDKSSRSLARLVLFLRISISLQSVFIVIRLNSEIVFHFANALLTFNTISSYKEIGFGLV